MRARGFLNRPYFGSPLRARPLDLDLDGLVQPADAGLDLGDVDLYAIDFEVAKHLVDEASGDLFDQVVGLFLDDVASARKDHAVVQRIDEPIGLGRAAEVGFQFQVDPEPASGFLFPKFRAVMAEKFEASESKNVHETVSRVG